MYPGGKGNCYQQIINQIPPHEVYIEPFLGGGYVMKAKRPAAINIGVELDRAVLRTTASSIVNNGDASATARNVNNSDGIPPSIMAMKAHNGTYNDIGQHRQLWRDGRIAFPGDVGRYRHFWRWEPAIIVNSGDAAASYFLFACRNALDFLEDFPFKGDEFVYLDPPYLMQSRSSQRPLYNHEFGDRCQHERLLSILLSLPCHVAISGYWSSLYESLLSGWRTHTFEAVTRSGNMAQEWLWMNYPEPSSLHDYSFLGDDFRQRERIKRKAKRWVNRFQSLPELERKAILSELARVDLIANHDDVAWFPDPIAKSGD